MKLTEQILAGIQKMGCECSDICKTCVNIKVPASESPCKGCKYGSMGGSSDNYTKNTTSSAVKTKLIESSKPKKDKPQPPTDDQESETDGGSGNVSNTPPAQGEKRAYQHRVLLDVLKSLKK